MCEEIEACAGATKLVEEVAKTGLPMAIATSSRYSGVEKKRRRYVPISFYFLVLSFKIAGKFFFSNDTLF